MTLKKLTHQCRKLYFCKSLLMPLSLSFLYIFIDAIIFIFFVYLLIYFCIFIGALLLYLFFIFIDALLIYFCIFIDAIISIFSLSLLMLY